MRLSAPSTRGRWQWKAFGLAGLIATAVYVADVSPLVTVVAFAFVGVSCVLAQVVGPLRHRARPASAWALIATASALFLVGVLIRPALVEESGWIQLSGDLLFTIPGYLCMLAGVATLLRSRGGVGRHAVIDGLLVCLGAALVSTLLLAVPAASIAGRSLTVSVLAGLYPFFDLALLLLLVNMTFTTAVLRPSFAALLGAGALMVAGDLAYAVIAVDGMIYASPLLDVPFLLAYTLLGITAIHPSVTELGHATRRPVQAWSLPRLLVIGVAMTVPFVLLLVVGDRSVADRLVLAAGGLLMVLLLVIRAVSAVRAQVAAHLRAEHQAMHDPLTGLPNRRRISAEIDRLLRAVRPDGTTRVWVHFLDLDGFKWVNDSWGHDTGDQLVLEVARRLRGAVPAGGSLARVGGDAFVLVHEGDEDAGPRVVQKIQGCFSEAVHVRETDVVISASIGVASAAPDASAGVTAEALMRDADTAMYRSKAEGPGRATTFDVSMRDRVRDRIELEVALRAALNRHELRVAYQPIVDLRTGHPLGAEVLVRWEHPERGPISPAVFIPIAEDAGLIAAIGTFVRCEAVRQLSVWRGAGTVDENFWMSINVSPHQLRDTQLPMIVADELLRYNVPPRVVVLEITESVMVDSSNVTDHVLAELRAVGVRLVVDDFGTGFSALGYLRRFPVTGVKIDRSFVDGLGTESGDEEIVRAVVAMSTALGLTIVAEGVETQRQRDVLADIGVALGQGWLWGRAVPADQFASRWGALTPAPARPQLAAGNS